MVQSRAEHIVNTYVGMVADRFYKDNDQPAAGTAAPASKRMEVRLLHPQCVAANCWSVAKRSGAEDLSRHCCATQVLGEFFSPSVLGGLLNPVREHNVVDEWCVILRLRVPVPSCTTCNSTERDVGM